jgi:hypothetical protein
MVALVVNDMRGRVLLCELRLILWVSIIVSKREVRGALAHQSTHRKRRNKRRWGFCDAILMAQAGIEFSWWKM